MIAHADIQKAIETLDKLSPLRADDRSMWLQVGMALHSVDSSQEMLRRWDHWSRQSEKYKEGECARQWRSFKADGGVGLGTLLHWAKADSGEPPRNPEREPPKRRRSPKAQSPRSSAKEIYPSPEDATEATTLKGICLAVSRLNLGG